MELISAAIGILGVIIGWLLNELTTIFRGRPKLCFQMVATPENELTEKEYRVKKVFLNMELKSLMSVRSLLFWKTS